MDKENIAHDLMVFDEKAETKDGVPISNEKPPKGRKLSPDLERVYLTEIKYYRDPVHAPQYEHDDFIRDSDSARYRPLDEIGSPNESETIDVSHLSVDPGDGSLRKSGSTSSNDEPPPLPPRRNKSRSESDLRQRLLDAGIDVNKLISNKAESMDELLSPLKPTFDEHVEINRKSSELENNDILIKNLHEFESNFPAKKNIDSVDGAFKNPFKPYNPYNPFLSERPSHSLSLPSRFHDIKSLSTDDILLLEGDQAGKQVTFEESERQPKPPPRPPLPKNNRFSCPAGLTADLSSDVENESIYFASGLFEKAKERNEEAVAFCTAVAEIRKQFKSDDHITNPGYVAPELVHNNAFPENHINITVYLEPFGDPKSVTCMLSSTASECIIKCVSEFFGKYNDLDVLSDQFVLKVIGFTMYLQGDIKLSDYVYIQECKKFCKKVEFSLVRRSHMNVELSRDQEDDKEDCHGIYFEHYFNVPSSLSVSERGLYILLDTYNAEAAKLLAQVSKTHEAQYIPDHIIQVVKAITNVLAKVELLQVQDAVNLLLSLKKSKIIHRTYTLGAATKRNYNEYMNPEYFDKGRFHLALQKLTSGVYSLIELYCKAFNTEFTLHLHEKELVSVYERIDPRSLSDDFTIRLGSIHRVPAVWKSQYEQFEVEVGLYYGGNLLCPKKRSKHCKLAMGFFEHLPLHEALTFSIQVKKIPRESKIGFLLYGVTAPKKGTDGKTILGWFTCNVYNDKGFLLSGSQLFGLLSSSEFNPAATCATNYIQQQDTVIIKVDLQAYHTEVIFPQPVLLRLNTQHGLKRPTEEEIANTTSMLQKDVSLLSKEEKAHIWKVRFSLNHLPSALKYVLLSAPGWDSENVLEIHTVLGYWARLPHHDALELLQADFPDNVVRESAVQWLNEISDDDLCDYLPELVQALKYEAHHNSSLAQFLIRRAIANPRIAHFLFWHLKYYTGDVQFCQRFQIVLSGLLSVCGARLRAQFARQDDLVVALGEVAARVKAAKEAVRTVVLQDEIRKLNEKFDACVRLPLDPAIKVSHVLPEESSYFSSFTVPLKVAFKNVDPRQHAVNAIFKIGDDLRKDLVTQLMFGAMNKLWLKEGLDMNMMLYKVLPTGPLTGLIEIVPNAATFREIHVQHGLTGSFKDDSLALWLQRFNSSEEEYHKAIENFTRSAAGYCVATYLLGIGDRHNDNIMLTKNGHLFHIDFSKFMGELQKFGSIKRDRVPFVLTPDMAYVINNGVTSTQNFQKFIEFCCNGFNIIRRSKDLILNLLGLMVFSGIPYLSYKEDLSYVREALQLHLTDEEATVYFTRLIENSLSSRATQLNFFIHNVAHMKNVTETALRSSRSSSLFSFSNKVHSAEKDGEVTSARVVDFQKRYLPEKHYVFVINITRAEQGGPRFVFRRFEDFQELHAKLSYMFNVFSGDVLPELPAKIYLGRSQIRDVAIRRRAELDGYLENLSKLDTVWESEIIYTFLHSYIKDIEEERRFAEFVALLQEGRQSRIGGRIKLTMSYKNDALRILIMHASKLVPRRLQSLANSYVKLYLLPDPLKQTKRKTKTSRKSLNPTFNETLVYDLPHDFLTKRVLQITVWDRDTMSGNEFLGGVNFYLSTCDLNVKRTEWFDLTNIGITDT